MRGCCVMLFNVGRWIFMSFKRSIVFGLLVFVACVTYAVPAVSADSSADDFTTHNTLGLQLNISEPVVLAGSPRRAYVNLQLSATRPQIQAPVATDSNTGVLSEQQTVQHRLPINLVIVLDRSGSMQGEKLQQAKQAASMAIEQLDGQDTVAVVAYNHVVDVVVPATRLDNPEALRAAIANIGSGGDTGLFAGVAKGVSELQRFLDQQSVNRLLLISDGLANVGPAAANELEELGQSLSAEGIAVTTIGLGLDYHEDLLVALAKSSDGNHVFAETADSLDNIFNRELADLKSVVALDIDVEIMCADGVLPVRVLGRDAEIIGQVIRTSLNQLYDQQDQYIFLEVELPAGQHRQTKPVMAVKASYWQPSRLSSGSAASSSSNQQLHQQDTQQQRMVIADQLSVYYSNQPAEVLNSRNFNVLRAASALNFSDMTKQAVQLRDAGQRAAAQETIVKATRLLRRAAREYEAPQLESYAKDADKKIKAIVSEDPDQWRRARKSLAEEQFLLDNQQTEELEQRQQQKSERSSKVTKQTLDKSSTDSKQELKIQPAKPADDKSVNNKSANDKK